MYMDFKEFYKLLDEAIAKDESGVVASDENYNAFIFNRYLSFYHPQIAILLSKTTNRVHWIPDGDDEEMSFKCMKGILPKLPKAFIQYIKKPAVVASQELEITEDDIKEDDIVPFRYVKFQNVNSVTVFVQSNQGEEETRISYFTFIGTPVQATNMNDFKRVVGKKGESH